MPSRAAIHPDMSEELKAALMDKPSVAFSPLPAEYWRFHAERGKKALNQVTPDWVIRGSWEQETGVGHEVTLYLALESRETRLLRKGRWNGEENRWELSVGDTGWVRM